MGMTMVVSMGLREVHIGWYMESTTTEPDILRAPKMAAVMRWTIVMMMLVATWFQDPQRGLQAEAIAFLLSLYSSHKSHLSDPQLCQVYPSLSAFLNATASAQKHSESLQTHRYPVCHVCSTAKLFRFYREFVNNGNGFLVGFFLFFFFFLSPPTQSSQGYSSHWLSAWCQPVSLPRKCTPEFTFPRLPAVLFLCFCSPPPLFFLFYKSYFGPLLIKMTDPFNLQINTVLLIHQVSLHNSLTLLRKRWVPVKFCKVPKFTQVTE